MERKFKHKITNKIIKIGGNTGLSCQTLIGNSNLILGDIIKGEDWQEVVEKDYEILTFILYDNYRNIYHVFNGKVNGYNLEEILSNTEHHIHSIKRLSDGEIFTIGDNISFSNSFGIIKLFRIEKEGLYCDLEDCRGLGFNFIQKVKQPLFTTEDGVDIFEDDYYYSVEKLYYFLHEKQKNYHCTNEDKFWIFSTKEKAEEYILMNKPCLSINDIIKLNDPKKKFSHLITMSISKNKLKKLVQEKLKTIK